MMNALKARGLKPGVSDVMIALPRGRYHGAFLELKFNDSSPVSKEQGDFVNLMEVSGYRAAIKVGYAAAVAFVIEYMALGPFKPA